ncbi:MAG: ribosome small subunit-dependent GTPase A [Methanococcaceae archaeon]
MFIRISGGHKIKGIVYKVESKDFYVLSIPGNEKIRCSLKGKFKLDNSLKKDKQFKINIAVVGDKVEFDLNQDGTGVIYEIASRRNYLSRKLPKVKGASYRGERLEQVIASNVDNLMIVSSLMLPKFNNKLIDRIMVAGESSHLTIHLIINKMDLASQDPPEFWIDLYSSIGYNVIPTSTKTFEGIDQIKSIMASKTNLFWGHSGVGKSSIINAMFPELQRKVGEISTFTQKGKHTTVNSIMDKIDADTFLIDTPGIREIDPYGITKENLGHYFVEFLPFIENCRFNTCTHFHEPACGVIQAVEDAEISFERYESYLSLVNTIEDDMIF